MNGQTFIAIAAIVFSAFASRSQSPDASLSKAVEPTLPCGPAALAIAMKIVGCAVPNHALDQVVLQDGSSNFGDLQRIAQQHGAYAVPVMLNSDQLSRLSQVAILQLVRRPSSNLPWKEHFTVFAGPGKLPGNVCVFDPIAELGRGDMPLKVLAKKWTGAALIVSRSPIDLSTIAAPTPSPWRSRVKGGLLGASTTWLLIGGLLFFRLRWSFRRPSTK